MMTTLRNTLVCLLLLAAIILLVIAGQLLVSIRRTTEQLPKIAEQTISREMEQTRRVLDNRVESSVRVVDRQLSGLRADLRRMQADVSSRAETQVAGLRADLNSQLSSVLVPVSETITQAQQAIPPAVNTLNQISETADLTLDCDHNPDCLFNRYVGAARAVEKTSVSVSKTADTIQQAAPETTKAIQSTTKDVSVIVGRFAKPVSWIRRVVNTAASVAGKFIGL